MKKQLEQIVSSFQLPGQLESAVVFGSGHIHDTYKVIFRESEILQPYIFQRINHIVFQDPKGLMKNMERILSHLHVKTAGQNPGFIPTQNGESYFRDHERNYWRAFTFIKNTRTYEKVGKTCACS